MKSAMRPGTVSGRRTDAGTTASGMRLLYTSDCGCRRLQPLGRAVQAGRIVGTVWVPGARGNLTDDFSFTTGLEDLRPRESTRPPGKVRSQTAGGDQFTPASVKR